MTLRATTFGCLAVLLALLPPDAPAQSEDEALQPTGFPVGLVDDAGWSWDVQSDGTIKDGTRDAYDDALRLQIDGSAFPAVETGSLTAGGRELVIGPRAMTGDLRVTRRILVPSSGGFARYLEILENPGTEAITVELVVRVDLGSDSATRVLGTTNGDRELDAIDVGLATDDGSGGTSDSVLVHVFADPAAAQRPRLDLVDGVISATQSILVPGRGRAAFLHVAVQRNTVDEATRFLSGFDPPSILETVGDGLRPVLVNFGPSVRMIPPLALPREEDTEIVELVTGDSLRGLVAPASYVLDSYVGKIEVKTADLAGIEFGVPGKSDDRILLDSGSVYSGRLSPRTVSIEVPSTGTFEVPATRMSRLLMRRPDPRAGDSPAPLEADLALLLSGDRFQGTLQGDTIGLRTRYGALEFHLSDVAALHLTTGKPSLHQLTLADGSVATGLLVDDTLRMKLDVGPEASVPVSNLMAFVRGSVAPEKRTGRPTFELADGDVFVGRPCPGQWRLDTGFGEIKVPTERIAGVAFLRGEYRVIRITMWDGGAISGRILEDRVALALSSGRVLSLDPAHLDRIVIPTPEIPAEARAEIEGLVEQLGDPDWNRRQEAKNRLSKMGVAALPILRERAQSEEDPEVQAALHAILQQIESKHD